MKKLTAVSAAALTLLTITPAAAGAADTYTENGVTYEYTVSGGKAVITSANGAKGEVTIPAEIDGNAVTAIGAGAFFGATELGAAILPEGLESIGDSAFMGCLHITEITIPDSVTSIGKGSFMSCTDLTSVTVGAGITEIPEECFYSCPELETVQLPEGLLKIGAEAFFSCPELEITVPESVTEIGENALGMQSDARTGGVTNVLGFLIYGTSGSSAEQYAEKNGIDFLDPDNYITGDINGDSFINASDASEALAEYSRASTGAPLQFTKKQRIIGDMDSDGFINATDASEILAIYAHLSTQ